MDQREKCRIRIYNHNAERITLECKEKIRRKTSKSSCPITLLQCRQLMEGVIPVDIEPDQQVLHKLAYRMAVKLMRPVVIVDYNRVPYVYRLTDANVRITFDYHITSVSDVNFSDIFKKDFLTTYTNGSVSVLEVTAVLMVTAVIACYIFLAYRLITRKTFYSKTFNISLAAIAVITAVKEPLDLVFLF